MFIIYEPEGGCAMEDEIDLYDIFDVLWKDRLLIIGIFMIVVLVAGVVSLVMPPSYRTSSIVALGNFDDMQSGSTDSGMKDTIYTKQAAALQIMLSDEFLIDVFKELNMTPDKFKEFKRSIGIVAVSGTDNLLKISVDSKSRQQGMPIIQGIIRLFVNRSEGSYDKQRKVLSNDLAITQVNMNILDSDLNDTREALKNIQSNASGESPQQTELRASRMIEYLQIEETRRQTLLDHYLGTQKKLTLVRLIDVVQEPREPFIPVEVPRILIMAVAGMLGLIIGIFAVLLRDGLRRRAEMIDESSTR
jgi:uncharacterized protein involved in exopolysaccharide biosynthesis